MANLKSMKTNELAKLVSKNDPGAIAELEARGGIKDGKLVSGFLNLPARMQEPTQPTIQRPTITADQLAQRIRDEQQKKAVAGFQQAFQQASGRLEQERGQVDPRFRERTGRIESQDVMAREAEAKRLATGGIAGSGARAQSELGLSAITQGARTQAETQRGQELADIERRQTEAQQLRDFGIAQAGSDAAIAGLQSQLGRLQQQEAAQLEDARTASEREFIIARDQAQALNQRDRDILQADLERNQSILNAQIQQARDEGQFERAQILEDQRNQNSIKLEGVRTANTLREIGARGAQDRATAQFRADLSPQEQAQQPSLPIDTVRRGINTLIDRVSTQDQFGLNLTGESLATAQRQQRVVAADQIVNLVANGQLNDSDADRLQIEYGLTDQEIDQAINRFNTPVQDRF